MNQRMARAQALQLAGIRVLGTLGKGAFDEDLSGYAPADVERIRTALRTVGRELMARGQLSELRERRAGEHRARKRRRTAAAKAARSSNGGVR